MQAYEQLEKEFGEWVGNPNCVACSSGSTAIHLAIEALKLPAYSEIVTSEFNMIAVPRAISQAKMTPLFVDCNDDLLMNVIQFNQVAMRRCIKAVIPVHIYGRRCDMDHIHFISRVEKVAVIEDLAEAHGVMPHPDTDAACWSFYTNKIVHSVGGEGGMIAFKRKDDADYCRQLRSLGFTAQHDFQHVPRGINGRMSNLHAESILPSLRAVRVNLEKRRQVAQWYDQLVPQECHQPARAVDWVYDLRVKGMTFEKQDQLVSHLRANGVEGRHSFKPMSMQTEYKGAHYQSLEAYRHSQEVIYLPIRESMTEEEVKHNVETLMSGIN